MARFTLDLGGKELAIASLPAPKVVEWYVAAGGVAKAPPGWELPKKHLVAVWFDAARLKTLAEYADAVEEEAEP